ncbi:hypothetical protein MRX96_029735 [Rhipicephalus microplus]
MRSAPRLLTSESVTVTVGVMVRGERNFERGEHLWVAPRVEDAFLYAFAHAYIERCAKRRSCKKQRPTRRKPTHKVFFFQGQEDRPPRLLEESGQQSTKKRTGELVFWTTARSVDVFFFPCIYFQPLTPQSALLLASLARAS